MLAAMLRNVVRFSLCLFTAFAPLFTAGAADVELLYRNLNSNDGLPQDHIRAIIQTRDGFLWLGTDAGLARFDGRGFKTYGLREGLGAITVLGLLEARDGALWIATLGGGVSVMRNGIIEHSYGRANGLPGAISPALAEDADGVIWVAGVYRLEGDRFVPTAGAEQPSKIVFRDHDGLLWMSRGDFGIARWKAGKWSLGSEGGPVTADAFCEDRDGRLWIADSKLQLWCRDANGWHSWPLPAVMVGRVSSLSAAADGTLWIASYRSGVCGFRDGAFITVSVGGKGFLDLSEMVYASPDGMLWLGTSTNGLYSLLPRRIETVTLDDGDIDTGSNFVGALVEGNAGEFIAGTQGRGLFQWQGGKAQPMIPFAELNRNLFVNALLRRKNGEVWVGTGRGLFQLLPSRAGDLQLARSGTSAEVWDLCEDRAGGVWVGCGNGDLFHHAAKVEKINYGGGGEPIKGLAQTSDGTLWIGTRGNGLFRLKDGKSRRFSVSDGLGSDVVRLVSVSADGALWVGTAGGGLALWQGERFISIGSDNGLPDDVISQVAEDAAGRLWLGTNRGLSVLEKTDVNRLKQGHVDSFHPLMINRADGMISEECTIVPPVHLSDGRMAFATTHGFAILRPEDFQVNRHTPPVFVERVIADGKALSRIGGKMALPPGLERLEFGFTGLHFAAPMRLRFRSRLIGLEQSWGAASETNSVEYRHLPPGNYRFELTGSIGNGLWTPRPAVLEFSVAPHFWQTLWFKTLATLFALVFVATLVRQRERIRSRRKIESLKRNQAVHEERARIARDLHDDVGASLTQVALLSELADSDIAERPEQARELINEIFTTAKDVTRSLDEIVWAVNPAQDTLERFAAFLGNFVQDYARTTGLTGRIEIPDVLPAVAVTSSIRHHLYLATKEALHNVVKHAGATEIRLRLVPEINSLRLMIEDNGRGIAESTTGDGDGLENLRKRLDQIGGSCIHRDAPNGGTVVEMQVPLDCE